MDYPNSGDTNFHWPSDFPSQNMTHVEYPEFSANSGFPGLIMNGLPANSGFPGLIMNGLPANSEQVQGGSDLGLTNVPAAGGNEATGGCIRMWERGSGSGLPQAAMLTDTPAAVPEQPGKKRKGKGNGAETSRKYRVKNKKHLQDVEEELRRLREENVRLITNGNETDRKLTLLRRKIGRSNVRAAKCKQAYESEQIQVQRLSKCLKNMSYLQNENARLKADNNLLRQQVNAGTNGRKKWVKIPLENRLLKIKRNTLFLKIA